ncbi:MAG: hypothetical protein V7785_07915 [Bermanella sp.]
MIFLIDENKTISGFQTIPETTKAKHIIVTDEKIIGLLKDVLGFVQLDDEGQLPGDFYLVALIDKCGKEVDKLLTAKLTELKIQSDELQSSLVGEVPQVEKETWLNQEQEAKAWQLDNDYSTPVLDVICQHRQCEKSWLVEKVIEKANGYKLKAAEITGKRQKLEDDLKVICTVNGLDSKEKNVASLASTVESLRAFSTAIEFSK